MNAADEEPEELRRCLRDVMSLLALAGGWRSLNSHEILQRFSEALQSCVQLDVLVARLHGDRREILHFPRLSRAVDARDVDTWFGSLLVRRASAVERVEHAELGLVTAVHEPLGYYAAHGYVIAASHRSDFPSASELAVIRAAISMASATIETSRAIQDRDEALRAKDDFLALLGHELRNPLAPITTALTLIRQRNAGQLTAEEQVIARQVDHLIRLVDDLRDVSHINRGTLDLQRAEVELAVVVEQAIEACATLMQQRHHTLEVDVPDTGLLMHVDPFRLQQVLVNILVNAARYTREGGRIELRASAHHDAVQLVIRDNGVGIAPDLMARIFEPFVQALSSRDTHFGGLGIGLSLVRSLIELEGGSVKAHSDGPGLGSQFTLTLPRIEESKLRRPLPPVAAAPRLVGAAPSHRILVVDDNADAGELLGIALKLAGHEVRVLQDPHEVDATTDVFVPEAVVLDLGMPELDGYAVAEQLRRKLAARVPRLIALTGYSQPDDVAKTREAGFSEHFVKPVDIQRLLARISELCAPSTP